MSADMVVDVEAAATPPMHVQLQPRYQQFAVRRGREFRPFTTVKAAVRWWREGGGRWGGGGTLMVRDWWADGPGEWRKWRWL